MSVSTINSAAERMNAVVASYDMAVKAIHDNKDITKDAKDRMINERRELGRQAAREAFVALWGDVVPSDERPDLGSESLDKTAPAWRDQDSTSKALHSAKQSAGLEGVNLQMMDHAEKRVRSEIANIVITSSSLAAGNPKVAAQNLTRYYESASKEERIAFQDYGGMLLEDYNAREFVQFKLQLVRDREARVNTAAVQRATQDHIDIRNALEDAYRVTRNMINKFAGSFVVTGRVDDLFNLIRHDPYNVNGEDGFPGTPRFERGYRGMVVLGSGAKRYTMGAAFGGG